MLEIGHFLGRSTACIAESLKESRDERKFISYDLGFISKQEFSIFFNKVHNQNVPVPKLARQIYNQKTTSTELATKNLSNLGLIDYVELISGNFIEIDNGKYSFIFCDAMHEANEIRLNLPQIINRSEKNVYGLSMICLTRILTLSWITQRHFILTELIGLAFSNIRTSNNNSFCFQYYY